MRNQLLVTVHEGAVLVGPAGGVEPVGTSLSDGAGVQVPPVTLSVSGGVLVWPWSVDGAGALDLGTTLTQPPVAVLEDVARAQDWLWALYGRDAALAVGTARAPTSTAQAPGQDWLPAVAARFAFGTWLVTWWPASTTDGIPALDLGTVRAELEPLGARLDLLFDGADPPLPASAVARRSVRDRYALAAGPAGGGSSPAVGVRVSMGVCGTWWSDWPAGWVDASDRAVSWRLEQDLDRWSFQVRAAAGPTVVVEEARLVAEAPGRRVELRPERDSSGRCWLGEAVGTDPAPAPGQVRVYLPGFAPEAPRPTDWQESVRSFARARLAAAGAAPDLEPTMTGPWWAERAASTDDDD